MKRTLVAAAVLWILAATPTIVRAQAECPVRVGEYSGTIKAEWLTKTRQMRLLEDFAFKGPDCRVWPVPKGAIVDGASIPRVFWSVIGGPFEGRYRDASVVHDYYCQVRTAPSNDVHEMFYYAMVANGVDTNTASLMYYAVSWFGPRWQILKGSLQSPTGQHEFVNVMKASELAFPDDVLSQIARSAGQPIPKIASLTTSTFTNRMVQGHPQDSRWLVKNGVAVSSSGETPTIEAFERVKKVGFSNTYRQYKDQADVYTFFSPGPAVPAEPDRKTVEVLRTWIARESPTLERLRTTAPSDIK